MQLKSTKIHAYILTQAYFQMMLTKDSNFNILNKDPNKNADQSPEKSKIQKRKLEANSKEFELSDSRRYFAARDERQGVPLGFEQSS